MSTLKPKHWVFLIPADGSSTYILYAPVHRFAVRVSAEARDVLSLLLDEQEVDGAIAIELKAFLQEKGLLTLPKSWHPEVVMQDVSGGHKITLSLTNKCNLRCIYCYAETGVDFTTMPWEVAKLAVDNLVAETVRAGDKKFSITFHGGGEVFVEYALLQRVVTYAREQAEKHALKVSFSAVTNTTLIDAERAKWLKEVGFSHFTVSLDGTREVHDKQRPHSRGSGSFDEVMIGIGHLRGAVLKFSIRATVTDIGVDNMPAFVEFLAKEVFPDGDGSVHFEPMSLCGRASHSEQVLTTDAESFTRNYLASKSVGERVRVKVTCSMDTFQQERKRFCGASYATMSCFAPNGMVSACSRVTKPQDTGADLFVYARVDSVNATIAVDTNAVETIKQHGTLPSKCEQCFARWNCQGNCPISRYAYPEHHEASCIMVRELLLASLIKKLDKNQ